MVYQFEFQLREDYKRYAIINEGDGDYLYLDTKGNVTVGIGHLLKDQQAATDLVMYDKNGKQADALALENEYRVIKSQKFGKPYGKNYYLKFVHLYMHTADINHLYQKDFRDTFTALTSYFPEFNTYPETAQLALLDLVFNVGMYKMSFHFLKLMKAIKQRDWQTAATESHRKVISEDRNTIVKNWFLEAAKQQSRRN